jgi:hypothetical protein
MRVNLRYWSDLTTSTEVVLGPIAGSVLVAARDAVSLAFKGATSSQISYGFVSTSRLYLFDDPSHHPEILARMRLRLGDVLSAPRGLISALNGFEVWYQTDLDAAAMGMSSPLVAEAIREIRVARERVRPEARWGKGYPAGQPNVRFG